RRDRACGKAATGGEKLTTRNPLSVLFHVPFPVSLLLFDHDARRGPWRRHAQLIAHLSGDIAVNFRVRTVRFCRNHGKAGVGGFADYGLKRHLAEERHLETRGFRSRSAMTENFRALAAFRAEEVAH